MFTGLFATRKRNSANPFCRSCNFDRKYRWSCNFDRKYRRSYNFDKHCRRSCNFGKNVAEVISSSSSTWCLFSWPIRELYTHGTYFLFSLLAFHSVPPLSLYSMLLLLNFSSSCSSKKKTKLTIVAEVFQNFCKKKQQSHNISSFFRTIKQER